MTLPNGGMSLKSRWKLYALDLAALAAGLVTAICLIAFYIYLSNKYSAYVTHVDEESLLVTPFEAATLAACISLAYGLVLIIICTPVWLWITKRGVESAAVAGGLGFTATLLLWVSINIKSGSAVFELIFSGLPYALSGMAAGFVTWWACPHKHT